MNDDDGNKSELSDSSEKSRRSRRYTERTSMATKRFAFAARKASETVVPTVKEAMNCNDRNELERAIRLELKSLQGTQTWNYA